MTPKVEPELLLEDDIESDEEPSLTLEAPDDEDINELEDAPPDPEPTRRAAPSPMEEMVPIAEYRAEQARRAQAEANANAMAQRQAPAAPVRRGFVDPAAAPEVQRWQGEVEGLIGPAIQAQIQAATTPAIATALRAADADDLRAMRSTYEDFDSVAQKVDEMRGPYMQAIGQWLPREEFYFAIRGRQQHTARTQSTRGKAVRRAAAAGTESNRPPATGRRAGIRITKDNVSKLTLAQMEKLLGDNNVPMLG